MAVPKKKVSKSRRNNRRAHDSLKQVNVVFNKTTGEPQLPHHVSVDGYYGDKQVVAEKVKQAPAEEAAETATQDKKETEKKASE